MPGIVKLTHHKLRQPQDIVSRTTPEYSMGRLAVRQPVNLTMPVAEDVFELSFLVVSGTRAYVVRRPLVPVVRGSEAARKPEG